MQVKFFSNFTSIPFDYVSKLTVQGQFLGRQSTSDWWRYSKDSDGINVLCEEKISNTRPQQHFNLLYHFTLYMYF